MFQKFILFYIYDFTIIYNFTNLIKSFHINTIKSLQIFYIQLQLQLQYLQLQFYNYNQFTVIQLKFYKYFT